MARLRRAPLICLMLLVAVIGGAVASAADSAVDELTRVLPDDVAYFVATGGSVALESDFRQTNLGRLWNDPGTQVFVASIRTELMALLAREADDEDGAKVVAKVLEYGRLVLERPMVIGVAGAEVEEGPAACVFAILDAGDRQPEFAAKLTDLEAMAEEEQGIIEIEIGSTKLHSFKDCDDVPIYWGWIGKFLVVAVNDVKGVAVAHVATPRAKPTGHFDNVPGPGDLLAIYCDVQKLWGILRTLMESEGEHEHAKLGQAVLDELGIGRVGRLISRVGFDGSDLVSASFAEAPAPRTGLLAALKPIDLGVFNKVDRRAVTATAFNYDLAGLYDTVIKAIKTVAPEEDYAGIQERLSGFESQVGFKIRGGLLDSLAGPVVFYSLPAGQMVEAPMGGVVAMVKLEDVTLFEKTMVQIGGLLAGMSEGVFQVASRATEDGRAIHVWSHSAMAMAQVMPSWSIVEGHVVIGSNTELCRMGMAQMVASGEDAGGLTATEGFKAVAKSLPQGLVAMTYTDSEAVFKQSLVQLQTVWPVATMVAMEAGVKLPVMVPALGYLAKDMKPSCEYTYADADGFHGAYRGSGIEVSVQDVAAGAMGAGILMPALARVRERAFRMTSGTNLSGIGKACLIYANDHEDKLPPDLETLLDEDYITEKSLISKRHPDDFEGPSYIYVSGQTIEMYPGNVVAYEDPRLCQDGVNVVFLDSHVEFVRWKSLRRTLKATYDRLGREMPEFELDD